MNYPIDLSKETEKLFLCKWNGDEIVVNQRNLDPVF